MNRLLQVVVSVPDERTLQAWEDMRSETLHDLQDGAIVAAELIESLGSLMVALESWPPR